MHPITLAFRGPDRHLERPFAEAYFQGTLWQVRMALAVAAFFFAAFAGVDAVVVPEQKHLFWAIRWGVACPISLALLGFTYSRHARGCMQAALCLGTMGTGLAMIVMLSLAPADRQYTYLAGLVQILFFVYTFLRIRFIWASCTFTSLIAVYIVWAAAHVGYQRLMSDIAFLLGINTMGMLVCYAMEYGTRKTFFLSRRLESKKRRLHLANQLLEKRVENRTADLTRSNEQLARQMKERQAIERKLRDSQRRFRRMINNVTDYVFVHDAQGTLVEVNHRMAKGLGYHPRELVGRHITTLLVPEQRPNFSQYLARLGKGHKATGSATVITKDGRLRLLTYSNVMAHRSSTAAVTYCLARDMTNQQQTEKALAESRARLNDIFDTAAAGMLIVDGPTGKVVEVNPAAAQMLGASGAEVRGRPIGTLIRLPGQTAEPLSMASRSSQDPLECELLTGSGQAVPILKTMRPMASEGQSNWVVSFISIQKVKAAEAAQLEMERKLGQAQHLQAIGTLAGGIAHDFNNILYGIMGYAQLAMDDAPNGSVLKSNLDGVLTGSQRAKELVAQILAFSRRDDTRKEPIAAAPVVKEALKLLRASIPATVAIEQEIAPNTAAILANPIQIHQVVMNLCTNAAHAMLPHGGLLRVCLDHWRMNREELGQHGPIAAGDYVRLRVSDTGTGMSAALVQRIFEPFFTTKPQGEGTGMGLSVVLGVVQAHDGAIRVRSAPGEGSCFEVLLPVTTRTAPMDMAAAGSPTGGTERILLVDDERALLQMGNQVLSKLGYRVTVAQDPREALALFDRAPGAFDLVITDLTMPHLIGTELARRLLAIRPDLPILLCTGYGDEVANGDIKTLGIRELILKPLLRNELAVAIRRALAAN